MTGLSPGNVPPCFIEPVAKSDFPFCLSWLRGREQENHSSQFLLHLALVWTLLNLQPVPGANKLGAEVPSSLPQFTDQTMASGIDFHHVSEGLENSLSLALPHGSLGPEHPAFPGRPRRLPARLQPQRMALAPRLARSLHPQRSPRRAGLRLRVPRLDRRNGGRLSADLRLGLHPRARRPACRLRLDHGVPPA